MSGLFNIRRSVVPMYGEWNADWSGYPLLLLTRHIGRKRTNENNCKPIPLPSTEMQDERLSASNLFDRILRLKDTVTADSPVPRAVTSVPTIIEDSEHAIEDNFISSRCFYNSAAACVLASHSPTYCYDVIRPLVDGLLDHTFKYCTRTRAITLGAASFPHRVIATRRLWSWVCQAVVNRLPETAFGIMNKKWNEALSASKQTRPGRPSAPDITAGNAANEVFVDVTLRQQDVQRWVRAVHQHASIPCLLTTQYNFFTHIWRRGSVVVRTLASHLGEAGSIPSGVAPGFSHEGIVPDDAAYPGRAFPRRSILTASQSRRLSRPNHSSLLPFHSSQAKGRLTARGRDNDKCPPSRVAAGEEAQFPGARGEDIANSLEVAWSGTEGSEAHVFSIWTAGAGATICPPGKGTSFRKEPLEVVLQEDNIRDDSQLDRQTSGGGRLLTPHLGEPDSIPSGVTLGFSRVSIVPDDAVSGRVFLGISRSPPPHAFRRCCIFTSLHPHRLSRPLCYEPPKSLNSITGIFELLGCAQPKM
ncbi:hypothetical protein PR048_024736 [Dryococelus australis]|uniref:Uncharacterized protein n=1 Tax=Dryococelus australis TaxID=614101 RepID=A0ABQ9GPE5_9NEOP|nr:hypothetical protein PR048_024736 [Dryococelus australis]